MIFDQFRESGEIPVNGKLATIVPIFKKGKKDDPGNYRPVSLTSVTFRENIILGFIEKHTKDNTVIDHNQYNFMRGKSCLTNLTPFYDKMKKGSLTNKPAHFYELHFITPETHLFIMMQFQEKQDLQGIV
ncbi:rna-directed dna polymerase from mobile element jockey-like [Pitangus sulphuratus]|nr:rna-directed dna polymerase from mobile element jockey-like [Pitangus sulphuratus]